MEAWQLWHEMARESERTGHLAEARGYLRSILSRYYYAAYQTASALLQYRGLTPPIGREAWNHEDTPLLLRDQLSPLVPSRNRRNDLAQRLTKLYDLRIYADYQGRRIISAEMVSLAGKDTRFILAVSDEILPTGSSLP